MQVQLSVGICVVAACTGFVQCLNTAKYTLAKYTLQGLQASGQGT